MNQNNFPDMQDYTRAFDQTNVQDTDTFLASVMRQVYGWMTLGLVLSAGMAWYTITSGLYKFILSRGGFLSCFVIEIALVIGLSWGIRKLSAAVALLMFLLFSIVNGMTLSFVFFAYNLTSIVQTLLITAGMFAGLAGFGYLTKKNLSSIGAACGMALWGLILVGVVNIFMRSARVDWALSLVGVIVFSGLTAWDAQKAKALALGIPENERNGQAVSKLSILCALELYLDFINLFLYLLRLFGGKGRK